MNFTLKPHSSVGLDLGRDSIKVVRALRRHGEVIFTHAARLQLPPEADDTVAMVMRWLETLDLCDEPCVIAAPGHALIFKSIELDPGAAGTIRQAAAAEARKLGKLTAEDIIHDVAIIGEDTAGRQQGLMVVARPDALAAIMALPTDVGSDIMDVIPSPAALFALARHAGVASSERPVLIVDTGCHTTEMVIGNCHGLRFARTFDIGADQFADTPDEGDERRQAWLDELSLCLEVYRDRFSLDADAPTKAVLMGGGAHSHGLPAMLQQMTGLPVTVFSSLALPDDAGEPSLFALAAGLALQGLETPGDRLSLAPPEIRVRETRRHDRVLWVAAAAIAAAAGLLWITGSHLTGIHRGTRAAEALHQASVHTELQTRLSRLQNNNRILADTLSPVYRTAHNRIVLLDLLRAIGDAKGPGDWIVSLQGQLADTNEVALTAGSAPSKDSHTDHGLLFHVQGYTSDTRFYSVRSMIDRLQTHPLVQSADLLDESALKPDDPLSIAWAPLKAIPFVLQIRTREPSGGPAFSEASSSRRLSGSNEDLLRAIRQQETLNKTLAGAWKTTSTTLSTFQGRPDLFNLPAQEEASLIDFRVALQETRRKLLTQAAGQGTELPSDLGLREIAGRDRSIRRLLFQLATIRTLAGIALDQGVSGIDAITPLEPVLNGIGPLPFMEQYPIRITLKSRLPVLVRLLQELGSPQHFMAVRRATLTRTDPKSPDTLEVTLDVASLVFTDSHDPLSVEEEPNS